MSYMVQTGYLEILFCVIWNRAFCELCVHVLSYNIFEVHVTYQK